MNFRHALCVVMILAALPFDRVIAASPAELRELVAAKAPAGCTEYSILFWDLYRAELWTDAASLPGSAYGLTLTYLSDFTRDELTESSVDEMARISGRSESSFSTARTQMEAAFRDVTEGDRITAWRETGQVRFFHNGRETGVLTRDSDLFLDIWLGEETRNPKGRKKLLSGRCDE